VLLRLRVLGLGHLHERSSLNRNLSPNQNPNQHTSLSPNLNLNLNPTKNLSLSPNQSPNLSGLPLELEHLPKELHLLVLELLPDLPSFLLEVTAWHSILRMAAIILPL
jgi:hypothetical protein